MVGDNGGVTGSGEMLENELDRLCGNDLDG